MWRYNDRYAVVSDNKEDASCLGGADDTEYYGGYLVCESIGPKIARRIIACVNACEGVSTEALEELIALGKRVRP